MATNGNANAVPFIRNSNLFRKRIMDSIVCWYDIGKQQCTNESMAENPVLADLSGNGHDIECFNFAWAGMSGIGGYKWNFNNFMRNLYPHTDSTIHLDFNNVPESNYNVMFENCIINNNGKLDNTILEGVKIRVRGVVDSVITFYMHVNFDNNDPNYYRKQIIINKDGEYELPDIDLSQFSNYTIIDVYYGFTFKSSLNTSDIVDIEQVPLYPNALVSDGVDDRTGTVPGFPKDEGTAIVIMQELEGNKSAGLLMPSDKEGFSNIWYNGLFVGGKELNGIGFYNNDGYRMIIKCNEDEAYAKNTSIFTWNNSIPKVTINLNNRESKEASYEQLHTQYNFFRDNNAWQSTRAALYSFLLFDRTLTTAEIEWVKKNMIESGGGGGVENE